MTGISSACVHLQQQQRFKRVIYMLCSHVFMPFLFFFFLLLFCGKMWESYTYFCTPGSGTGTWLAAASAGIRTAGRIGKWIREDPLLIQRNQTPLPPFVPAGPVFGFNLKRNGFKKSIQFIIPIRVKV
jgi:hypothetical protein